MLAAIRPDDWNFPLLLRVLGACCWSARLAAVTSFSLGWRRDSHNRSPGSEFWALLVVAFPPGG